LKKREKKNKRREKREIGGKKQKLPSLVRGVDRSMRHKKEK